MGLVMGLLVIVGITALMVLGNWLEVRHQRRTRLRRAIARQETTAIAALREGQRAKIRGVAAARGPLLMSPSGQTCIGYRITIDDVTHNPDLSWDPLVSREAWPSFLVTDETGTVAVQGPLDKLLDPSDRGSRILPPAVQALLAEDDVRTKDLWRPRQFWFREALLKVGDRVCVTGWPSLEINPAARGVMRGTETERVVVIDDDDAGG